VTTLENVGPQCCIFYGNDLTISLSMWDENVHGLRIRISLERIQREVIAQLALDEMV